MTSLFRRLGRYPVGPLVDPRENRLTESFAALLERVDGLASGLVAEWLGEALPDGPVHVRTQRATLNGRYVDLELAFGHRTAPELRVWVEAKHGASLHEDQIENYLIDVRFEHQERSTVVLLAPRTSMPEAPAGVPCVPWQAVARQVKEQAIREDVDDVSRWLLREFHAYLKEEGLTDEAPLTPATVFALSAYPAAERSLARLVETAHSVVEAEWGPPKDFLKKGGSKPGYGLAWWCSHQVALPGMEAPETWRHTWFEWTVRSDDFRAEPRDAVAFFAGATFGSKNSPLSVTGNEGWLVELHALGFERVSAWYWRLWRPLYLEYLLQYDDVEDQGLRLGEWIVDSFKTLAAKPPPA